MIKGKPRVLVETLRKDKEALGRFLTEDPKVCYTNHGAEISCKYKVC